MPHIARSLRSATLAVLLAAVVMPATAGAQPPAAGRQAARPPAPVAAAVPAASAGDTAPEFDAGRVREQFYEILEKYPPSLGRVLKLDPSLMANETYLSPYPGVVAFLAEHPEIARDASFYLERVYVTGDGYRPDEAAQKRREIQEMLAAFAAFLVFLVVVGVVIWLVRTILETRRWNRVSRTQAEVHSKLLDRFSSNEDLLAYIQTPVGRRFLESGPAPVPDDARPIAAPFSRILLSAQAGIVLTVAAVGMLFLSRRIDEDVSAFFLVIGVVTLAVGIGFLASSAAAYAISSRLGLLNRSDSGHA
jgi:NADH:ubiquinone oxidoreductase subunit 3 (subunit A)